MPRLVTRILSTLRLAAAVPCHEALRTLMAERPAGYQLPIVPGSERRFAKKSSFPGTPRFDELRLVVSPDYYDAVATALADAWERPQQTAQIRARILERLRETAGDLALAEQLPEITRSADEYAACADANCFNGALSWGDRSLGIRKTHLEEFEKILARQYRPLRSGEARRAGDVIVFRAPGGGINHAARYLNDEWVWHKPSSDPRDPPSFQRWMDVFAYYHDVHQGRGIVDYYRRRS